ncbi:MAG: hypothetical protein R3C61_02425 [Bacteroidia bacterium]
MLHFWIISTRQIQTFPEPFVAPDPFLGPVVFIGYQSEHAWLNLSYSKYQNTEKANGVIADVNSNSALYGIRTGFYTVSGERVIC